MNPQELMIGDWVYIKEYPMKPEAKQVTANHFMRSLCEFEPIPLTEEILKANGFEEKSEKARYGSVFYGMFVGDISISFEVDNGMPILTIEDTADRSEQHNIICLKDEVYDIHELQHALRLCGLNELANFVYADGLANKQIIDNPKDIVSRWEDDDALSLFKTLPHLDGNYNIVDDWGYTPNLYHFDTQWFVDWIHCEEGDSLLSYSGKTPEEAIMKACHYIQDINKLKSLKQ